MSSAIDLDMVRRLEELAFRGWPALESRDVHGWRLRFPRGYTKRANSLNPLGPEAPADDKPVGALERAYRERNQQPVWRLSPLAPAAINDRLVSPAYRTIERSLVQMAPLRADAVADPEVRIDADPTPQWLDAFAVHSPVAPHHRDTMHRMLAAIAPPNGFAFVPQA